MLKEIAFQNGTITYEISGKGLPVALIHGYLMSSQIWNEFTELLQLKYQIISVDLPGHGRSSSFPPVHSMDLMAETVKQVIQHEGINPCYVIGHSMGGYVALALLEYYPQLIKKLILLNTHPFEDSEQKIAIRNRIISLMKKEKKEFLLRQLLGDMISPTDEKKYRQIRESAVKIISKQPIQNLIATTEGIKLRTDRSLLLKDQVVPVKWFLGKSDHQIDAEKMLFQAIESSIIQPEIIDGGHMSFLELPYEIFRLIHGFFGDPV